MNNIKKILDLPEFSKEDLVTLLSAGEEDRQLIFEKAAEIKKEVVGNKVYFRGLIEYSNYCSKNCFYCGIRAGNSRYKRYRMTDDQVLEAARYAYENKYASIVIQSGEQNNSKFVSKVEDLLERI